MAHKQEENFVVSLELLKLFQWLIDHEQNNIKKLLIHALNNGFKNELMMNHGKDEAYENLQQNIIEFFTLLEGLIHETIHEHTVKTNIYKKDVPAISHINTTAHDSASIVLSMEKASAALKNNTGENPKEVFCKELLRRWKPTKDVIAH